MVDRERLLRSVSLPLIILGLAVMFAALAARGTDVQALTPAATYTLTKTVTYASSSSPGVAVSETFTVSLVFQNNGAQARTVYVQDNNPNDAYLQVLSPTLTGGAYYVSQFDAVAWRDSLGTSSPVEVTFQVRVIGGADKKVTNFAWLDDAGTTNTTPDAQDWAEILIRPDSPTLDPIDNQNGDGDYTVKWSWVSSARDYVLEEDDNPNFTSPSVRYAGTNTQYLVAQQGLGTWYYRVRTTGTWVTSNWSNIESAEVLLAAPVIAPIDNPEASGNYTVEWSAVAGAILYTLEEDDDPAFGSPTVVYEGDATQTSFTDHALGTWYYRVRANTASAHSSWSPLESTTVGDGPPNHVYLPYVPRNWPPTPGKPVLQPISNPDGDGSYTVSWSAVQPVDRYVLQEATDSTFSDATQVFAGTATSYDVDGKGAGRYYYRVRARNEWGNSPWSEPLYVDVHWEAEVNDFAPAQANGPIVSGLTYYGTFPSGGDINDYYYFELPMAGRVELFLRNIPAGHNYDLVLRDLASIQDPYKTPPGYSGNVGNLDEHILLNSLAAGTYYVQVHNRSRLGSSQPYYLQLTY